MIPLTEAATPAQRSAVVRITPEEAARMLATSRGNRPTRQRHIEFLARMMARGEWLLSHQGIAFDRQGALRDGHHRLHAVIQSGCTVPMQVTFDLDPRAYAAIDQGVPRSASDVIGRDRKVVEVASFIARLVYGVGRPSVLEVESILAAPIGAETDALLAFCNRFTRTFSTAPVRAAAVLAALMHKDHDYVWAQYTALVNLDYSVMSAASAAFARQQARLRPGVRSTQHDLFVRSSLAFDPVRANVTRSHVRSADSASEIIAERTAFARQLVGVSPDTLK